MEVWKEKQNSHGSIWYKDVRIVMVLYVDMFSGASALNCIVWQNHNCRGIYGNFSGKIIEWWA